MSLYPKINDDSILLHNECNKLMRRNSKKLIVKEVEYKLFKKSDCNNNEKNKIKIRIFKENIEDNHSKIRVKIFKEDSDFYDNKLCFLALLLNIIGCNNIK